MMRNESEKTIWNEFEERLLDSEELSDREIWERIYGRNTKPFDWRKSNIEIESPLRGFDMSRTIYNNINADLQQEDMGKIFCRETISPAVLKELTKLEKPVLTFKTEVNNTTKRAFATFLADYRKKTDVKLNDIVLFRAIKANKKFEFISKIGKWGKFYVPKEVIESLRIQNHESVLFEFITKDSSLQKEDNKIDFADIVSFDNKIKIIPRKNNFVTLWKKQHVPVTIPRFIDYSNELYVLSFLVHGDGHYKSKFYFSNAQYRLHKFVIDEFEKLFKIPKDVWRCRILHTNPDSSKKAYWKKVLEIYDEQFYPTVSKSTLNTQAEGDARIGIDSYIVAKIFHFVLNKMNESLNSKNSLYALDGLLNAEGSASIEKDGLHKLTISFNQNEKEMFSNILRKSNLFQLCQILKDRFIISDWNRIYEFVKIFAENNMIPFSQNPYRAKNVAEGFLNHRFTKTLVKYLSVINNNETTYSEIADVFNHRFSSVRNELNKERIIKFINFNGKGVNRSPLKISISDEGKRFLNAVEYFQTKLPEINKLYNQDIQLKKLAGDIN